MRIVTVICNEESRSPVTIMRVAATGGCPVLSPIPLHQVLSGSMGDA